MKTQSLKSFSRTIPITLIAWSASALAGGAIIGSGSDGNDELISAPDPQKDVVISVPDSLRKPGQLMIKGEKGTHQSSTATYRPCAVDRDQRPIRSGCGAATNLPLNKAVSLYAGAYLVEYSNTYQFILVNPGELSVANLRKLTVQRVDGSYKYQVFLDNTDKDQLNRFVTTIWALTPLMSSEDIDNYCIMHDPIDSLLITFCGLAQTKSYQRFYSLFNSEVQENGATLACTMVVDETSKTSHCTETKYLYNWVTDPKDGEFISVFPGTYGVIFTNKKGISTTVYGKKVE